MLFKDQKVLKQICDQQYVKDINDDALKKISEEVECKLRQIIENSRKYSEHFNRDKIKVEDIKYAIIDLNMQDVIIIIIMINIKALKIIINNNENSNNNDQIMGYDIHDCNS